MVRDRQFYRQFFAMVVVLILQNVITLSVNLADIIMLGAYSENALAGVAAVNQVQFIYQQLLNAAGEGIVILGTQYFGKGQFGPNDNCTRGQIATFLWRYAGCNEPQSTEPSFTDVPKEHGFFKAVQWASENHIAAGYNKDHTFGVNRTCTRGQCVTFIYRSTAP